MKNVHESCNPPGFLLFTAALLWAAALQAVPLFAQGVQEAGEDHVSLALAPPLSEGTVLRLDKEYWHDFLRDPKEIVKLNARWGAREWVKAGLFSGLALTLYHYDEHIQDWFQGHRSGFSKTVVHAVRPLGNGYYTIPLLAGFYMAGRHFQNERAQETACLGFESFVLAGAVTQALKYGTHRDRPRESPDHQIWHGPSFSGKNLSFPSGEAASAFAVATIFASEYGDKRWVPPLAYGLSTLTALARVHDNAHWCSDVFVGSCVGYFTSQALYRIHHSQGSRQVALVPILKRGQRGLRVACSF